MCMILLYDGCSDNTKVYLLGMYNDCIRCFKCECCFKDHIENMPDPRQELQIEVDGQLFKIIIDELKTVENSSV